MKKLTLTMVAALVLALLTLTAQAGGVTLDLSGGSFADLAELTALMDQQEGVSTVDLTDVPLTMDERRELLARYPGMH